MDRHPTTNGPSRAGISWFAALITCLVIALALPAGASAARGLTTGFAALSEYQSPDKAERDLWLDRTVAAGAGLVRISISWDAVARSGRPIDPTNPRSISYDFSTADGPIRDAEARGLNVMITVNVAPEWAEGPGRPANSEPGSWMPSPSDVADFMQAVAARYSGNLDPDGVGPEPPLPFVQSLEVWNEPNSTDWLAPQFEGKRAVSPETYRSMLNASYRGIKRVNPRMLVVGAGAAPYGDPPGGPYPPTVQRVQPAQFWQQVFCLRQVKAKKKKGKKKAAPKFVRTNSCPASTMFDVFAAHPIDNTGGGPLRHGPRKGDVSTPDLGKLTRLLRAAERAGTAPGGRHPIWVTEFWWDSKPPNPSGAPLLTQARWIEQSLYLFWKDGASAAINFQIRDAAARPDVHAGFQSGVYFQDGRPKPSLTAFRFPFVTERINQRTLTAWGKAPVSGKLLIQRKQGKRWRNVSKLKVGKGSVFRTQLRLSGKQLLRAKVGAETSVTWKQAAGGARKSSGGGGGPSGVLIGLLVAATVALVVAGTKAVRHRKLQHHRRALPLIS